LVELLLFVGETLEIYSAVSEWQVVFESDKEKRTEDDYY